MVWREIGFDLTEAQRKAIDAVLAARREKAEADVAKANAEHSKKRDGKKAEAKTSHTSLPAFVYSLFQPKAREWQRERNRMEIVGYVEQVLPPEPPKPGEEPSRVPRTRRLTPEMVKPLVAPPPKPESERGPHYLVVPFPPTPLEWMEWGVAYYSLLNNSTDGPSRGFKSWDTFESWALDMLLENVASQATQHELEAVEKAEELPFFEEVG